MPVQIECPNCEISPHGARIYCADCEQALYERPLYERPVYEIDFLVSWDWHRYYCQQAGLPDPGHNRLPPPDILEDIRQSQLAPKRKLQAGQWSQPKAQPTTPFPVKSSPPTGGKRKTMGVRID